MLKIFISYSHKDEDWRNLLAAHLAPLERAGLVQVWHDRKLLGGDRFDDVIAGELNEADLVLLLVSADFINSEYCYGKELEQALLRERQGTARVLPVILRACRWTALPFGKLNATPKDGRPVAEWSDRDAAMDEVAHAIERIAKAKKSAPARKNVTLTVDAPVRSSPDRIPLPVTLARKYGDREKDQFRLSAFRAIRETFETSIAALPEEQGLSGLFESLDAARFKAVLYRDGRRVSGFTVFTGGEYFGSASICYANSDSGSTSTINEQLSVDSDDQGLFLRPLLGGMQHNAPKRLNEDEAASYFWERFTEALKWR
jgi:hypothetical protein